MFHRFFGKKQSPGSGPAKASKAPKPKPISQPIGTSLVVKHQEDPDWVWGLMNVILPDPDSPTRHLFRVYRPQDCALRGVKVGSYRDLDQHPDLVLYYGWMDRKTKEMELMVPSRERREAS